MLESNFDLEMLSLVNQINILIPRKYLSKLNSYNVVPLNNELVNKDLSEYFRLYKLKKIVLEKKENIHKKLSAVYQSLHSLGTSVITIIDSDGININLYFGIKNFDNLPTSQNILSKLFEGLFLGYDFNLLENSKIKNILPNLETFDGNITISSSVDNIKNYDTNIHNIENLIESLKNEKYTILVISDPIDNNRLSLIKKYYEDIYSKLKRFANGSFFNKTSNIPKTERPVLLRTIIYNLLNIQTILTNSEKYITKDNLYNESNIINKLGNLCIIKNEKMLIENERILDEDAHKNIMNIDETIRKIANYDVEIWNTCTYILTDDIQTNSTVASIYHSIIRGHNSSITNSFINTFSSDNKSLKEISKYLSKLHHPIFCLDSDFLISPSSLVSSFDMTIQAGFPAKSVAGLPIVKYTSFARDIISDIDIDKSIEIGNIFHFGKAEKSKVKLSLDSLALHTFVTGSTGSGKSNTIYNILDKLISKNINFMIIEPAKGEYKNVFGSRNDVFVYGSNPKYTDLLRINPFSFNDSIHVLEHIDRLIDIFNVCWPMYAAMPEVLKQAIESAYISAGWNLDSSENMYGKNIYPNFIDVLESLKNEIRVSDYSEEVKSNYIGALVTRIKSFTNGLIGRIFTSNELSESELFDNNVIVDLSRIGSLETKSLIMGILIMKLSEYRISSKVMNQPLKHITVLEEAHNLLKRTSTEQNMESSNLVGKSVEMLSNAIAEMRTYGEGFIIADQSPFMVDMSAIRNTNTKIILRLPDYSDRRVVGLSCNLTDEQIEELARLQTGIACVYQNNWIEAVLSKIDKADINDSYYSKKDDKFFENVNIKNTFLKYIAQLSLKENIDISDDELINLVDNLYINTTNKIQLKDFILKKESSSYKISNILYNIFDGITFLRNINDIKDMEHFNRLLYTNIFDNSIENIEGKYVNEILNLFMLGIINNDLVLVDKEFYDSWYSEFYNGGNV